MNNDDILAQLLKGMESSGEQPEPQPAPPKPAPAPKPPAPKPKPAPAKPKPEGKPTPPPVPKPQPAKPAPSGDSSEGAKRLMTANVHCKLWEAKRSDTKVSKKVIEQAKADKGSGKFIKNLIDRDKYIKPLEQIRTRAKSALYKWTCPWTYGTRVLTVEAYPKLKAEIDAIRKEYNQAVTHFIDKQYANAIEEAKGKLGSLWNKADYPTGAQLAEKFHMSLDITPFPDGVNLDLPEEVRKEIAEQVEANFAERTETATLDLVDRVTKALSDFAERVRRDPKQWKDSAVQNLKDILDIAPALNVSGSSKICEAVELAEVRLEGLLKLKTEDVRKLPEQKREAFSDEASKVADEIQKLLLA